LTYLQDIVLGCGSALLADEYEYQRERGTETIHRDDTCLSMMLLVLGMVRTLFHRHVTITSTSTRLFVREWLNPPPLAVT
jgi:hypothetical protein